MGGHGGHGGGRGGRGGHGSCCVGCRVADHGGRRSIFFQRFLPTRPLLSSVCSLILCMH